MPAWQRVTHRSPTLLTLECGHTLPVTNMNGDAGPQKCCQCHTEHPHYPHTGTERTVDGVRQFMFRGVWRNWETP